MAHYLVNMQIAGLFEIAPELFTVEGIAFMNHQQIFIQIIYRCQPLHQRVYGNDEDTAGLVRHPVQSFHPLGNNILMGRKHIIRQSFPIREQGGNTTVVI